MQQQSQPMAKPATSAMAPNISQTQPKTNSKTTAGTSTSTVKTTTQTTQPNKPKRHLWWTWFLMGLAVGFLGTWVYFGVFA